MARRRRHRGLLPTVWLDWTPDVAALFQLVPADWTPPMKVRVSGSLRRTTFTARFTTPAGHTNRAHVRVEPVT